MRKLGTILEKHTKHNVNLDDYLSKEDIIREVQKHDWVLKDRTVDYYVRLGIIKKATRLPGDKQVYWEANYIIDELLAVKILITVFSFKLSYISKIAKATRFHLKDFVTDIYGLCDDILLEYNKFYKKENTIHALTPIYNKYAELTIIGKMKTQGDRLGFRERIEEVIKLIRIANSLKTQLQIKSDRRLIKRIDHCETKFIDSIEEFEEK